MASLSQDVVREILLHLPIKPLFRFRTVCKFWREVIDSTYFKQSHIHQHANNNDEDQEGVFVKLFNYEPGRDFIICSLIQDLPEILDDQLVTAPRRIAGYADIVGPVNGLFCIYKNIYEWNRSIAVYNPGLDLIKELPFDGYPYCLFPDEEWEFSNFHPHVSIGYDNIAHDYKVLQMLPSSRGMHALIYSKTTNSWRGMACQDYDFFDQDNFLIVESIKSTCTDGGTAYWVAKRGAGDNMKTLILSFDMKREVFRISEIPDFVTVHIIDPTNIVVKRDKFVLFDFDRRNEDPSKWFSIYEARIEENSILHWDLVAEVPTFANIRPSGMSLWRNNCVVLNYNYSDIQGWNLRGCRNDRVVLNDKYPDHEVIFYDYYQNKL